MRRTRSTRDILLDLYDDAVFALVWAVTVLRYPRLFRWYQKKARKTGRWPDPAVPRTANDKYFWRKMFDHDPRHTQISDKLGVRDWLRDAGIAIQTPKVLWVGKTADAIPDEVFAQEVVIKTNHASGTNIFVTDRKRPHRLAERTAQFLNLNLYNWAHQWGYRNIDRKLFVEEMLTGTDGAIAEYKYYTYGTRIELLVPIYDRQSDTFAADMWKPDETGTLRLSTDPSAITTQVDGRPLPPTAPEMLRIAKQIGAHFDHVRVDLYSDGTNIWLGELTLYNLAGHISDGGLIPDHRVNTSWDIRRTWFLTTPQTGWRRLYAASLLRRLNAGNVQRNS